MISAVLNNQMYEWSHHNLQSRNNFLFAAGAASVTAGLIFPDVIRLLDLLVIFTLCLSGSVLAVALCSRQISDLSGFPAMIVLTVCMQITSAAASLKLFISEGMPNLIAGSLAKISLINLHPNEGAVWFWFLLVSIAILAATCKTAKMTLIKSKDFFETAAAARQAQNNNLALRDENFEKNKKSDRELNFFLAGAAAVKFIFCCCFILFIISITSLIILVIAAKTAGGNSMAAEAACGSIGFQLLGLLTSGAVHRLITKTGSASLENNIITEEQYKQRIKVAAREISSSQHSISNAQVQIFSENSIETLPDGTLWSADTIDNENGYKNLTQLIKDRKFKTILMAASSTEHLPVTIAVNTAVNLAQSAKVLLVDCDLERKAVMQVFDIKSDAAKPVQSCVKNLFAGLPDCMLGQNANAIDSFDYIIIYVPKILNLVKAKHLIRKSQSAMLFGQTEKPLSGDMNKLHKILCDTKCSLIKPHSLFSCGFATEAYAYHD